MNISRTKRTFDVKEKNIFHSLKSAHFRLKKQNIKNVLDATFKANCKQLLSLMELLAVAYVFGLVGWH